MDPELFKNARKAAIDRNVAKRQALKKKWDRHCKYGVEDTDLVIGVNEMYSHEREVDFSSKGEENWVRMLDEGTVVDGDGYCYAVIKKGVLKDFFENLPESFEGYIDRDHVYALRLGKYSKKDMKLVSIGDGRYGIDINVKLDDDYYATRDLLKQGEHRAVSVEMAIDFDEFGIADKITGDKKQGKYLVPIINQVNILGYAVCENPKNANSIKDDLLEKASAEGEQMDKDEEMKKLAAEEAAKAAEEGKEAENTEEGTKAPDTSADPDENLEANDADKKGEGEGEKEPEDAEKGDEATEEGLEELAAAIKELKEQMAAKDKKIAELENQLAAQAETKKLSTAERVAELLKLAKGTGEPSAAEGSKVNTPSEKADKYAAEDAEWDAAAKTLQY